MKDFSGLGAPQVVTYTVKVVASEKWHEIDTLLLHAIPMTMKNLEGHSHNANL